MVKKFVSIQDMYELFSVLYQKYKYMDVYLGNAIGPFVIQMMFLK